MDIFSRYGYTRWFGGVLKMKKFQYHVTKLPDEYDPNIIIKDAIIEKYKVCPCCGLNIFENDADMLWKSIRENNDEILTYTYIYADEYVFKSFSRVSSEWKILHFRCKRCGARWRTDPFPTNIRRYNKYIDKYINACDDKDSKKSTSVDINDIEGNAAMVITVLVGIVGFIVTILSNS